MNSQSSMSIRLFRRRLFHRRKATNKAGTIMMTSSAARNACAVTLLGSIWDDIMTDWRNDYMRGVPWVASRERTPAGCTGREVLLTSLSSLAVETGLCHSLSCNQTRQSIPSSCTRFIGPQVVQMSDCDLGRPSIPVIASHSRPPSLLEAVA